MTVRMKQPHLQLTETKTASSGKPLSIFISKNFKNIRSIIESQDLGSIADIEYYSYGVYVHYRSTTHRGELLRANLNMSVKFSPEDSVMKTVDFVYGTATNGRKQICKISPGLTPLQRKEKMKYISTGLKNFQDYARKVVNDDPSVYI